MLNQRDSGQSTTILTCGVGEEPVDVQIRDEDRADAGHAESQDDAHDAEGAAEPERKTRGRGASLPTRAADLLIEILVDKNPKIRGAAERFAKYRPGMSVAEYASEVGDPRQAYRDLSWDIGQGFISIAPRTETRH